MFIVHVFIKVKPEYIEDFKAATLENVRNSIQEPGIARFDFLESETPHEFLLIEVYRHPEDAVRHKETEHYIIWRDTVAEMMAKPRSSIKYSNIAPGEGGWDSPS
ncbi:MAG TPA: putative quinol monooxygenase [Pontiella sp.]